MLLSPVPLRLWSGLHSMTMRVPAINALPWRQLNPFYPWSSASRLMASLSAVQAGMDTLGQIAVDALDLHQFLDAGSLHPGQPAKGLEQG